MGRHGSASIILAAGIYCRYRACEGGDTLPLPKAVMHNYAESPRSHSTHRIIEICKRSYMCAAAITTVLGAQVGFLGSKSPTHPLTHAHRIAGSLLVSRLAIKHIKAPTASRNPLIPAADDSPPLLQLAIFTSSERGTTSHGDPHAVPFSVGGRILPDLLHSLPLHRPCSCRAITRAPPWDKRP